MACYDMELYVSGTEESYDESSITFTAQCEDPADCSSVYINYYSDMTDTDSCIKSRYFALLPLNCSENTTHCIFDCDVIDCALRDFDGSLAQSLTGVLSGNFPFPSFYNT